MHSQQQRSELVATKNGRAIRAALFEIGAWAATLVAAAAAVNAAKLDTWFLVAVAGVIAISLFFRNLEESRALKFTEELLDRDDDQ